MQQSDDASKSAEGWVQEDMGSPSPSPDCRVNLLDLPEALHHLLSLQKAGPDGSGGGAGGSQAPPVGSGPATIPSLAAAPLSRFNPMAPQPFGALGPTDGQPSSAPKRQRGAEHLYERFEGRQPSSDEGRSWLFGLGPGGSGGARDTAPGSAGVAGPSNAWTSADSELEPMPGGAAGALRMQALHGGLRAGGGAVGPPGDAPGSASPEVMQAQRQLQEVYAHLQAAHEQYTQTTAKHHRVLRIVRNTDALMRVNARVKATNAQLLQEQRNLEVERARLAGEVTAQQAALQEATQQLQAAYAEHQQQMAAMAKEHAALSKEVEQLKAAKAQLLQEQQQQMQGGSTQP